MNAETHAKKALSDVVWNAAQEPWTENSFRHAGALSAGCNCTVRYVLHMWCANLASAVDLAYRPRYTNPRQGLWHQPGFVSALSYQVSMLITSQAAACLTRPSRVTHIFKLLISVSSSRQRPRLRLPRHHRPKLFAYSSAPKFLAIWPNHIEHGSSDWRGCKWGKWKIKRKLGHCPRVPTVWLCIDVEANRDFGQYC